MLYFDRVCKVVVENKSKIEISDCKIKFEIIKSYKSKDNMAKVEIYNLSPQTRKLISDEDSLVRLFAGYSKFKGLVEIGQGDISKIKHNRDKTEVVTEMYLAEGLKKIRSNPVSFGYAYDAKVKLSQVLEKITQQSKITFRKIDVDDSKIVDMGYSDSGSVDHALDNLALIFNFTWSFQNGVVTIKGNKAGTRSEIMLLSPESGLILHPESVKEVSKKIEKAEITKLSKKARSVQSLLQPSLQIHDIIKIQSQDINGLYEIQKMVHIGDTRGNDWYTTLEVVPVGSGDSDLTPKLSQNVLDAMTMAARTSW